MKAYWVKTNWLIKNLFSGYVWAIPNSERKIYLTFDDGPTPVITDWVLDQLKKYDACATFFCIGKNIQEQPAIFKRILAEGHQVGNHTYNHLNGWKTTTNKYIENLVACQDSISKWTTLVNHATLFRPPYGKIKRSQAKLIKAKGYKIIMWDVLSADFDLTITAENCLNNVISNIKPGSIIVFHDSNKASSNLKYALPRTLEFLQENNYHCGLLL